MKRLQNKVAIITGAAGGMGKSEAKLFAEEGAHVIATDIQESTLKLWVDEYNKQGLHIDYMKQDVTSATDWAEVCKMAIKLYGKIDILVNNAGVYPGYIDCLNTTESLWNNVLSINLTGPFLGCKEVVPYMIKAGGGSIVNIASIAGLVGGNGVAYSASKGGLCMLSKDLAVSLAPNKIRVNTICPGGVLTPMTEGLLASAEMKKNIQQLSPQGRIADPIEIAWGVVYLASDEASFLTGAEIAIDGGAVAK